MNFRSSIFTMVIIALLLTAAVALAAGRKAYDKSKVSVETLNGLASTAATSRCDTAAITKGTFKTYTASGYIGINAQAVDTAGAAVSGKWKIDGKQVWVGSVFEHTNNGGNSVSTYAFDPYSAALRTLTICNKRQ